MRDVFCVLLMLLMASCSGEISYQRDYWKPSVQQLARAEEIARNYANVDLGVTKEQLNRMKSVGFGTEEAGRKCIWLDFYDTKVFPNWKQMVAPLGGFPCYFAIGIDTTSWTVIDHYASRK